MKRIYVPTGSASDWQCLLADPEKHWKTGFSAKTLAHCWEDEDGFPPEIKKALTPRFPSIEPLIIMPEHKVPLRGGGADSQCDIWVLAKCDGDLISIAVEGKVAESFGPTVAEWKPQSTQGKTERYESIRDELGLTDIPGEIRCQLLHRTAAAIVEARRFSARHAVVLIHSFGESADNFKDFERFGTLLGLSLEKGVLASRPLADGLELHVVWVDGEGKYLKY